MDYIFSIVFVQKIHWDHWMVTSTCICTMSSTFLPRITASDIGCPKAPSQRNSFWEWELTERRSRSPMTRPAKESAFPPLDPAPAENTREKEDFCLITRWDAGSTVTINRQSRKINSRIRCPFLLWVFCSSWFFYITHEYVSFHSNKTVLGLFKFFFLSRFAWTSKRKIGWRNTIRFTTRATLTAIQSGSDSMMKTRSLKR